MFFLVNWVGDDPQEDFAKFVCRSERKVEKYRNHAIFFTSYIRLAKGLAIGAMANQFASKMGLPTPHSRT
jgi:hypothetical protein